MTLANTVRQKLSETPAADTRHELSVSGEAGDLTLYLTAERRDAWTTVVWEMSLRRAATSGDIAAWAERIARDSSGLLECLRVIEVDGPRNQALVRSDPPTERDGKIFYYELVLQGISSALVRRYEGAHSSGIRAQVPFVLTNEVLAKWVSDLAAE